jgi:hypothetical protein
MSKLAFIGRPWVAFDAANANHRQQFALFQRLGTWGKCPVRFIISDDHGDLVTMIQRRLIEYYINQEFGRSEFLRSKNTTAVDTKAA